MQGCIYLTDRDPITLSTDAKHSLTQVYIVILSNKEIWLSPRQVASFSQIWIIANNTRCWSMDSEVIKLMMAKPEWIDIRICPTTPLVVIIHSSENYYYSNMIRKGKSTLQCFPRSLLQPTPQKLNVYMRRHQTRPFCKHYVDEVDYCSIWLPWHFRKAQWENVNVMLELRNNFSLLWIIVEKHMVAKC